MKLRAGLERYMIAGAGPLATAGSQFLLLLLLLKILAPADFGRFSFLLTTIFFAASLWGALFCAPLPVLINRGVPEEREQAVRCIMAVNLVMALGAGLIFLLIATLLGFPRTGAALFALYAAMFLLRWFARAHAYAVGKAWRTTLSDIVYAVVLVTVVGTMVWLDTASVTNAIAALLLSIVMGMLPFGRDYLRRQVLALYRGAWPAYRAIWRVHSGWSFLGVVTTEATVNAHVYIVTLVAGPTAYAPIAATALMIRPIVVALNALAEFERASMARQLGQADRPAALRAVGRFRLALLAVWMGTGLAILLLFALAPRLVFPPHYALATMATGVGLWMAVAGVRVMYMPYSTLLQAAGEFRRLAKASVVSCGASIASVVLFLALVGPLWAITGILIGEMLFAIWVWRGARLWRAQT